MMTVWFSVLTLTLTLTLNLTDLPSSTAFRLIVVQPRSVKFNSWSPASAGFLKGPSADPSPPSPLPSQPNLLDENFFDIAETERKSSTEEPKGSAVSMLYNDLIIKLAKCRVSILKDLVQKYMPSESLNGVDSLDKLVELSLQALWTQKSGDWEGMRELIDSELSSENRRTDKYMTEAILAANKLTEKKIKDLIVEYADRNALPKLDKKSQKGKYLKADYAMTLVDIVREVSGNDYEVVFSILDKEAKKNEVKGFGTK